MDLDQQIEKTLQKFSLKIQELTAERDKLEKEKNDLLYQSKQCETTKNTFSDQLGETNKKTSIQSERKSKFKSSMDTILEELKNNETKLNKQKSNINKYEQSMNEKIGEMKKSYAKSEEERTKKTAQDRDRLSTLTSENDEMQKKIYEDDREIEKLQLKVDGINEKEVSRSAMLNDFIKRING
jgi:chromosome segregation ATPase